MKSGHIWLFKGQSPNEEQTILEHFILQNTTSKPSNFLYTCMSWYLEASLYFPITITCFTLSSSLSILSTFQLRVYLGKSFFVFDNYHILFCISTRHNTYIKYKNIGVCIHITTSEYFIIYSDSLLFWYVSSDFIFQTI